MPLLCCPGVKRTWLALLLLSATVFAGRKFPAQPDESTVPDEVIVRLKPGADPKGILKRFASGGESTRLHKKLNLFKLRIPSAVTDALLDRLAADGDVDFVEPNRVRSLTGVPVPSDSFFSSQWALNNVHALQAWGLIPDLYFTSSTLGSRIKVAVLDTGADCTHPDFANSGGTSVYSEAGGQLSQALSHAYVLTARTSPSCSWQDDHGHGTHTAGTIGAATNNAAGVASLGYGLELIIYKVLAASGSGDDATISTAIMDAADAGARVVSLSLGGFGYSQVLQDAVNYAWSKDTLVVAAAGNSNSNWLFFPAGANHAMGVAATDSNNAKASFSNYGPYVGIAAPGVSILSTYPTYFGNLSGYAILSGTSMATPHAAALAGLVATANAGLAVEGITQRIQQSASSTVSGGGWTQTLGYGVIDAFGALSGYARPSTSGAVAGQLVDSSGIPASGTVTIGGNSVTVDTLGLFRVAPLAPGTYTLSATGPAGTQSMDLAVVAGADTTVSVPLGVTLGAITGQVLTAAGTLSGAVVQALIGGTVTGDAVSDSSGQYSLSLPPGTYDLRVSAPGFSPTTAAGFTVVASSSQVVNITLGRLGRITGRVVDQDGAGLAGADVLAQGNGFSAGATTASDGTYSTPGLPAGSYSVIATSGEISATTSVGIVSDADATANFSLDLVTISVTPSSGTLVQSQQQQFTAALTGTTDQRVTWSRSPAVGSISSTGLYTAPATLTGPTAVTITATSVASPTRSASAAVTVANVFTLALSPNSVVGGAPTTGNKVTLDTAAPPDAATITLSSSNPSLAVVPASVTVAAGTVVSPAFTITTSYVPANTVVTISATYQGSTKSLNLTLRPAALSFIALYPKSIGGGGTATINRVYLDGPAGPSGVTVPLAASDTTLVSLPESVTVPSGATYSSTFSIVTSAVNTPTPVTISGSYAGVNRSATLTLNPITALSVVLSPASVVGGTTSSWHRVNLNGPAPAGGAVVTLSTSDPITAPVPASVTVPAGATSATFMITTATVTTSTPVVITASYGGASPTATLTVRPPLLSSLALSPTTLAGGATSTANRLCLDGPAPAGGVAVQVTTSNASASTPTATVTVPAGATCAAFAITSTAVTASTSVTITASYAGVNKPATLTVVPIVAASVALSPASMAGGTTSASHRVNLNGPAPAGGAVVMLSTSDPITAPVPPSVTVPAGATMATFPITTASVTTSTPVAITASYGGASPTATLTVRPPLLGFLTLYPTSLAGGATSTLNRVYLDGPATPEGITVQLTTSNAAVATPPASVLVPAGSTSVAYAITTSPVATSTPVTITATYGAVSKSVTLTVVPVTVASHSVQLTWDPSVSPDVVGYNVFRASSSGGPYTPLTSTIVPGTGYLDTTVEAGRTYYYVVTAVDAASVSSSYSNEAEAVVPTP